ncbi:MAG: cation:proton antiporter, partial [Prevotella sp.]|nr:cation:proton antiporter [Prevotella sp.]
MPDISQYFPITDTTWIFLVVLFIILSAPVIMSKLRIPHIVGMVLAGVIVGQYGLNILERDASFEMFGKVGLYYIMFLAGLE